MNIEPTSVAGVLIIKPRVVSDSYGSCFKTFNEPEMSSHGIIGPFVQENHSHSIRNVLRGLHYQLPHPQGKLVRVASGRVFDVVIDLRRRSPTFRRWTGVELSSEDAKMVWIPVGCAHGFLVLSDRADFIYKQTDYYHPECERAILWNDADLGISWPTAAPPILSPKDQKGVRLRDAQVFD